MKSHDLQELKQIVARHHPDLAGMPIEMIAHSWDSTAVDVSGQWILKFPRHAQAEARLRKEAALLNVVRSAVTLRVPEMTLHEDPVHSRHQKIPGDQLLNFDDLRETAKSAIADQLGQFYAELHRIEIKRVTPLGALALSWGDPSDVLRTVLPVLPPEHHAFAIATTEAFANLPPDPLGETYAFCDGHGWNMAYDPETQTLNGIYDFADSGIAPTHQEFVYATITSCDLATRIADAYERHSGKQLDRSRIATLISFHKLFEIAEYANDPASLPNSIRMLEVWRAWRGA